MNNKYLKFTIVIISFLIIAVTIFLLQNKKEIVFTIDKDSIEINVGSYKQIEYKISNNIKIVWKSNDENIATVDNNGLVYGKHIGTTIITGEIKNKKIICKVNIINENYNIKLEDIVIPNGEILISSGNTYEIPLTYVPNNAYIEKIDYQLSNDIVTVSNGIINAIAPGKTTLSIIINDSIIKNININVIEKQIETKIIQPINDIIFDNNIVNLTINERKTINYTINPFDSYILTSHWQSNNENVVAIDQNGVITGINLGNAKITLTINDTITKTISVNVISNINEIKFDYIPKKILKVDETITLYPTILPIDSINKTIIYESSNPNVLIVNNGIIKAINPGNAIITITDLSKTINKKLSFTVIPKQGLINSDQIIWNFNKEEDVIPKKADNNFFQELVKKGVGTIGNNHYVYQKYNYDINNSILTINQKEKILMRIYYPPNKDLSTLNTFTFIGGIGEENFHNYFSQIEKDLSIIKSSGIIILIANSSNIPCNGKNIAEATNFIKTIINQNSHARNNIGGYSNGGPLAGDASMKGDYDKIMIFNSSFYWIDQRTSLANKEIYIYSANNDSWNGTITLINDLKKYNFNNVNIISNNSSMFTYSNKYLVINPGKTMANGHTSNNITISHFFSFGCD